MRKQGICLNYKKKEHITARYSKLKKSRKYFGRKFEMNKSVYEMTK